MAEKVIAFDQRAEYRVTLGFYHEEDSDRNDYSEITFTSLSATDIKVAISEAIAMAQTEYLEPIEVAEVHAVYSAV